MRRPQRRQVPSCAARELSLPGGERERARHPPRLEGEQDVDVGAERLRGGFHRLGGEDVRDGAQRQVQAGASHPELPAVQDHRRDPHQRVDLRAERFPRAEHPLGAPDTRPGGQAESGGETPVGRGQFFQAGDDATAAGVAERSRGKRWLALRCPVIPQDYAGTRAQLGRDTRAGIA